LFIMPRFGKGTRDERKRARELNVQAREMRKNLKSEDPDLRLDALSKIEGFYTPEVTREILNKMLNEDHNPRVKKKVISMLEKRWTHKEAIENLAEIMKRDPVPEIRILAMPMLLQKIPDPRKSRELFDFWRITMAESLIDVIEREYEPDVCIRAMQTINLLIHDEIIKASSPVLDAFEKALDHHEFEVKRAAVSICKTFNTDRFRPIFKDMASRETDLSLSLELKGILGDEYPDQHF